MVLGVDHPTRSDDDLVAHRIGHGSRSNLWCENDNLIRAARAIHTIEALSLTSHLDGGSPGDVTEDQTPPVAAADDPHARTSAIGIAPDAPIDLESPGRI